MMFTSSAFSTPRLARIAAAWARRTGRRRRPWRSSSRPSRRPARCGRQPSGCVRRRHPRRRASNGCRVTTSRSMPRGRAPSACQFFCCCFGRTADVRQKAVLAAELGQQKLPDGLGHVIVATAVAGNAVFVGQGAEPGRTCAPCRPPTSPPRPAIGREPRRGRGRNVPPCPHKCAAAGSGPRSPRPWPRRRPPGASCRRAVTRQGPMKQLRQHKPCLPNGIGPPGLRGGPKPCGCRSVPPGSSFVGWPDRPNDDWGFP